jgi:thiazolylpeptide-type bacteriocin precursor
MSAAREVESRDTLNLTGLDIDEFEISDFLDESMIEENDLTITMASSFSCTTCICTCSCSS